MMDDDPQGRTGTVLAQWLKMEGLGDSEVGPRLHQKQNLSFLFLVEFDKTGQNLATH